MGWAAEEHGAVNVHCLQEHLDGLDSGALAGVWHERAARGGGGPMMVWLWETGSECGISDDLCRACEAASASLRDGQADSARIELALLLAGGDWLTSGYYRTGVGWLVQPCRDGGLSRVPLACSPETGGHMIPAVFTKSCWQPDWRGDL
jgi:hypothetical protein